MAVGLGIHGEPGIDETDVPTADGSGRAARVEPARRAPRASSRRPASGSPILNGLGALKYEELFVVYRRIAQLLEAAGTEIVDPHVGEYCTSFDMAGGSLTLFWLDDELERLWNAPVDTPAYRRGTVVAAERVEAWTARTTDAASRAIPVGRDESQAAATALAALDATVADDRRARRRSADGRDRRRRRPRHRHAAARTPPSTRPARPRRRAGAGDAARARGDAWSDRAGGTGALWRHAPRGRRARRRRGRPRHAVAAGVAAARDGIQSYGKAEVGDKTMVDAIVLFAETLGREVDGGATSPTRSDRRRRGIRCRRSHGRPAAPNGPRPPPRREEPRHA